MRRWRIAIIAALFVCPSVANAADDGFNFDGAWSGIISIEKDRLFPITTPKDNISFELDIHGNDVEAIAPEDNGKQYRFCRGICTFSQTRSNALIFGIRHGQPGDRGAFWVETWSFAVALLDANHMVVEYTRVVRNVGLEKSDSKFSAVFSTHGVGVFERAAEVSPSQPPREIDSNKPNAN